MILLLQPTRIEAPKRGKLNHIGFTRKVTAAVLPNSRQRFTSGEAACDKRIRLVLLLTRYFENPVYSVGRRQAGQIDKPQFGFLWRLLANVRQNFTDAA